MVHRITRCSCANVRVRGRRISAHNWISQRNSLSKTLVNHIILYTNLPWRSLPEVNAPNLHPCLSLWRLFSQSPRGPHSDVAYKYLREEGWQYVIYYPLHKIQYLSSALNNPAPSTCCSLTSLSFERAGFPADF